MPVSDKKFSSESTSDGVPGLLMEPMEQLDKSIVLSGRLSFWDGEAGFLGKGKMGLLSALEVFELPGVLGLWLAVRVLLRPKKKFSQTCCMSPFTILMSVLRSCCSRGTGPGSGGMGQGIFTVKFSPIGLLLWLESVSAESWSECLGPSGKEFTAFISREMHGLFLSSFSGECLIRASSSSSIFLFSICWQKDLRVRVQITTVKSLSLISFVE
mmetsp:Transcript_14939/g.23555  ORF Transcript_14939/g.23555 Transcript_14939/m.23555 type:complete len:213 (+) Transcript_14939:1222-1860(+)